MPLRLSWWPERVQGKNGAVAKSEKDLQEGMTSYTRPLLTFVAVLLVLGVALSALYMHGQTGLRGDDDNLWLYMATHKIDQPDEARAMEQQALQMSAEWNGSPHSLRRIEMRMDYALNYLGPVYLWHLIDKAVASDQALGADFPAHVTLVLTIGFVVTALLAWLVVLLVFMLRGDVRLWLALLLMMSLSACLMLLPLSIPSMVLLGMPDLKHTILNAAVFVLDPGHGFSFLSFTPRSTIAVLLLAVFALRWGGWYRLSWLLVLGLHYVHASLALLAAGHLLMLDLLQHRQKLRDPLVLGSITIAVLLGVMGESLWANVGQASLLLVVGGLAILLIVLWVFGPQPLALLARVMPRAAHHITQLDKSLNRYGQACADAVLLLLLWGLSLPVVWGITTQMSYVQNTYFWAQLHGRCISLLWPVVLLALCYTLVQQMPVRYNLRLVGVLLLGWLLGFGWQVQKHPAPWQGLLMDNRQHEAFLSGQIASEAYKLHSAQGFVFSESLLYYTLGNMLATHTIRWEALAETGRNFNGVTYNKDGR